MDRLVGTPVSRNRSMYFGRILLDCSQRRRKFQLQTTLRCLILQRIGSCDPSINPPRTSLQTFQRSLHMVLLHCKLDLLPEFEIVAKEGSARGRRIRKDDW